MVHAVWSTYCRRRFLVNGVREKICQHIKENAKTKNIRIDTINGHDDHLHCLCELNPELTIRKQMQLIKGESSYWVNKNEIVQESFAWEEDYYAVSVSESDLDKVRAYINNQDEHHKKSNWKEECDRLFKDLLT